MPFQDLSIAAKSLQTESFAEWFNVERTAYQLFQRRLSNDDEMQEVAKCDEYIMYFANRE